MSLPLGGNPSLKELGAKQWQKKDSGQVRCGSPRGVAPTGMTGNRAYGFSVFDATTKKK
jgi:hypothetical protein